MGIRNSENRVRELAGRRVLVCGGSSGIGLTAARLLGENGARTVLVARGEEALGQAAAEVIGCVAQIAADLSEADAAAAAVKEAVAALGGLDAVVDCAGAAAAGPFREMTPEDYERTVSITLLATMHLAHAALEPLERTGGVLVVVGSVAGRVPAPWLAAYAAAKHGVRGFLRSLACELRAQRSSVSVALIAPGPVNTPFWRRSRTTDGRLPLKLHGAYQPEDVAGEILRALSRPRPLERTVGGLMALATVLDALAPNLMITPIGVLARLGWRRRGTRTPRTEDSLSLPTSRADPRGGLVGRRSLLQLVRGRRSPGS